MNWLHKKFAQIITPLADLINRAHQESSHIRRDFPRQAQEYYESIVEEFKANQAASQPWKKLLQWMQINPQPDNEKYLEQVKYYARDVKPPNPEDFENWFDDEVLEFYIENGDVKRLIQILDELLNR